MIFENKLVKPLPQHFLLSSGIPLRSQHVLHILGLRLLGFSFYSGLGLFFAVLVDPGGKTLPYYIGIAGRRDFCSVFEF